MIKKGLCIILCLAIISMIMPGFAVAATTPTPVLKNGWSWDGESTTGLTGRFSGTVGLSTDKAVGKYSVKVTTKDDPYDWTTYGFSNNFKSVDTNVYSKVSIWVKPGPGTKKLWFSIVDSAKLNNPNYPNYGAENIILAHSRFAGHRRVRVQ